MTELIILVLFGLSVAGLLWAEAKDSSQFRWVFKPATSFLFVAYAFSNGALESAFGIAILAGLIFCAVGDILLIPKNEKLFMAGMAAFALGHGAYISAFAKAGVAVTPIAAITAIAMALSGGLVLKWLWPHLGPFRHPVAAYSIIISLMVVMGAATLGRPEPDIDPWRLAAGAVAFAVSDVSVAKDQFIERRFINRLWGLPLYFGAQIILASSV